MTNLSLKPPPITITADDLRHLSTLGLTSTEAAEFLAREIDRARVVPMHRASPDLVRMGSIVKYRDNPTGHVSEVTLVYPRDADGQQGRVSVLAPLGAALIGLSVGQTIDFATRRGEVCSVSVIGISASAW
jgi:regulator of nucleoside diphosphate kinase